MFSYFRYFTTFALLLICAVVLGTSYFFKTAATDDLIFQVSGIATSLTDNYVNTTWKKYEAWIAHLERTNPSPQKWKEDKYFQNFINETKDITNGRARLIEVNLYLPDGRLLITTKTGKSEDSTDASLEKTDFFATVREGKLTSRMLPPIKIAGPNGKMVNRSSIRNFIPIRTTREAAANQASPKPVVAVLELQFDVSGTLNKISLFQTITALGIIIIASVLIFILFLSSRRAESIIAKQHELNLELTAAAAAAEAENRDKSQFLANISHELRTPLNAIIGFSEILKTQPGLEMAEQHREYLEDIHSSGKHLLSLINDILDYSKAEAGKLEVDVSEIDAIKMVKNSMRLVIPRAESAQVTLMEDLPPKHFVLQTDAKKLKQVLLNLLSNAVKFTPAGGEVRVACWHNPENDRVLFEVKDTGIGIAQKDIARVMTPFGQVDSTLARRYEGTGLGLPLSRKLVEVMGGSFEIVSEVGKGTTVILSFPRVFDREAAVKAVATFHD